MPPRIILASASRIRLELLERARRGCRRRSGSGRRGCAQSGVPCRGRPGRSLRRSAGRAQGNAHLRPEPGRPGDRRRPDARLQRRLVRQAAGSRSRPGASSGIARQDPSLVTAAVVMRGGETALAHRHRGQADHAVLQRRLLDEYLVQAGPSVLSAVGAYQLEGLGAQLFEQVEGDFFTVLACLCCRCWVSCAAMGSSGHERCRPGRRHGLADRPFPLPGAARLLAAPLRHPRRLCAAGGPAPRSWNRRSGPCRRSALRLQPDRPA